MEQAQEAANNGIDPILSGEFDTGVEVEKGDKNLNVTFYHNQVTDKDHVKIVAPGDPHSIFDYEVEPRYIQRFRRQWELFKNEKDQLHGQTRIESVAWIDPGIIPKIKAYGIQTVEHLAAMADGTAGNEGAILGLTKLRGKAREFMRNKKKAQLYEDIKNTANEEIEKVRAEADKAKTESDKTMLEMRKAMEAMSKEIKYLQDTQQKAQQKARTKKAGK